MPIYEYQKNCDCCDIIDIIASVNDRNKKHKVYCKKCKKEVSTRRVLSKPLIKVIEGFSDYKDSHIEETLKNAPE